MADIDSTAARSERKKKLHAAWLKFNAARVKETQAAYYAANAESKRAASRAWGQANKERKKKTRAVWRAANPGKEKVMGAAYRAANRDKRKAYRAAYYRANLEEQKKYSADWRSANPEKAKESTKRWLASRPDYLRLHVQNYNARKRQNGGKLSPDIVQRLITLQRKKCACCGKPLGNKYHLDHRVPVAKGGKNEDSNMQLLTQRCNSQKRDKDPIDFMQERGFLL